MYAAVATGELDESNMLVVPLQNQDGKLFI